MELSSVPASLIIFIATIAVSLYALYKDQRLFDKFVLHPYSAIRQKRWFTVITSGFLHGSVMHLMFNMMSFYFFAFKLEMMIGSINFLIVYFLSMIISDIPSIIKNKDNAKYASLGASGAISGTLFSFILLVPGAKLSLFLFPIGIPAPIFGVLYIAYCYYAEKNANDNINHSAHLWGALAGAIITIVLFPQVINELLNYYFG